MMQGEALLGPLPAYHRLGIMSDLQRGFEVFCFNIKTDRLTKDPRLEPWSASWEPLETIRDATDPMFFKKWRNIETGEVINSDPRLTVEALRARGVDLTEFKLV
jgi:hypothetical protein